MYIVHTLHGLPCACLGGAMGTDRRSSDRLDPEHGPRAQSPRDARLNLRAPSSQLETIRLAAQRSHKSVSAFVLESATAAADDVLADLRWFQINDAAWDEFEALLDRPVVNKPRLSALLSQEDPFVD